MIEKHSSDSKCAGCHVRIDPFGFALEGFDAIGRFRTADTKATLVNGTAFEGLDGLRSYILTQRRDEFVRQFSRKLLGYALGRSVQLSDEPLLTEMQAKLKANDYKMNVAFESIILSRQFREIRGKDMVVED